METLKNYSLELDSNTEFDLGKSVCNKTFDRNSSLRANVILSFALAGTISLIPAHAVPNYDIKKLAATYENISLKKSQELTQEVSDYSKGLVNKHQISKSLIIENILSFKSLQNSWDGFEALPLGVKCAANAIRLLDFFDRSILAKISDIHPNPNGTITFEWENNESEIVSLEIGKDTFTYFVDFNSIDTKFHNRQVFSFENVKMLKKYISAI